MILKMFAVYDSKVEAYMQPFFMQSTGQACRSFEDTATDETTLINKHAADFTLFEIGTFDDQTATVYIHEAKINLGSANEYIKPQLKAVDNG